ncbi:phosphoribosylanthranilate isomerase [Clostridium estertheticum]|uniref:phosphoribosylanthranilate isomerase n=1 Tax=Clostridium estertheticum TaxID=238834 RepID=UPI001C7CA940|nr:phosphoribosylanthranilate isomerase [Clostridium estertheticum]MBX4260137.1 phosphoribosylanthranilate isomerase [Clostridium estertheticum]WLC72146.1 phosphoribosylanthranilate isomerase [Clostridium estertheticum]
MTKIKICGIRRPCDIEYLNDLLPEYVGVVFAKSKRQVDCEHACKLIENLSVCIQKVGVFVDENPSVVIDIAEKLHLDVLQFHGHENQEYINKFKGYEIWKALKINNLESISEISHYKCAKFLLDNSTSGSGESFNWNLAYKRVDGNTIMLAGGLTSENVKQGITTLSPYGVDVSSGVETDGFKDYEKIKEFIKKVRNL